MTTVLAQFANQTSQRWPLGLSTADIVKDLADIKSPDTFKAKLKTLKKNNLLEKVLRYGTGKRHTTLFEAVLSKKKEERAQNQFEKARILVNFGALEFFTTTNANESPLELLYKRTKVHGLRNGKGSEKFRKSARKLAETILRNQTNTNTSNNQNIKNLVKYTKHPINCAFEKHERYLLTKQTLNPDFITKPETTNNSQHARHSLWSLFSARQALALGKRLLPQGT